LPKNNGFSKTYEFWHFDNLLNANQLKINYLKVFKDNFHLLMYVIIPYRREKTLHYKFRNNTVKHLPEKTALLKVSSKTCTE